MQAIEPVQVALLCCIKHLYKDTTSGDAAAVPLPPLNLFSYLLECIHELNSPPSTLREFEDRLFDLPCEVPDEGTSTPRQVPLLDRNRKQQYSKDGEPLHTSQLEADSLASRTALVDSIRSSFSTIGLLRTDGLVQIFTDAKALLCERDEQEVQNSIYARPPIERRSPLGLFVRKMYLIYSRKPYDAMLKLVDRLIGWSENIKPQAGLDLDLSLSFMDESVQVKDWSTLLTSEPLDESEKGKNRQDGATTQRGLAYDDYMNARRAGHPLLAQAALRRFFDFRTPGNNLLAARAYSQPRALFALAAYHLESGGYKSSRAALEESMRIARQAADRECLFFCASLKKRLDHLHQEGRPAGQAEARVVGPGTSTDQLWHVKKGLADGLPVQDLMLYLYRAKALMPLDTVGMAFDVQRYRMNHEAIAAELWALSGSPALAETHWKLSTEIDLDVETRYTAICKKSAELAHVGKYDEALSLLLVECMPQSDGQDEAPVYLKSELSARDFQKLHSAFCHVVRVKAERAGHQRILDRLAQIDISADSTSEDLGADANPSKLSHPSGSEAHIRALLSRCKKLIDLGNPAQALKPLLEALTLSSLSERSDLADVPKTDSGGKGLVVLHLLALVMLADVEIQFQAPRKGELQLKAVWARIQACPDMELQAYARWTMAKCIISGPEQNERREEASGLMMSAFHEYWNIGHRPLAFQLLSDLAVLKDQMGKIEERDNLAAQWLEQTDPDKAMAEEDKLLTELGEMQAWWTEWSADVAGLDRFEANEN